MNCLKKSKIFENFPRKSKVFLPGSTTPRFQTSLPLACGTEDLERSIRCKGSGMHDKTPNLVIQTFYVSDLLIIFPPMPKKIKLGLMKQCVNALPIEGDCLAFPVLSVEKIKPGV